MRNVSFFFKNKKVQITLIIFISIILVYLTSIIFLWNKTPNNLYVDNSRLPVTSYKNIKKDLNDILNNKNIKMIDDKMGEIKFSLNDVGVTLKKDFVKNINNYDNKFWGIRFHAKDITNEIFDLNEDNISKKIKSIIETNKWGNPPHDAYIEYQNGEYIIIPEVDSTMISPETFTKALLKGIKEKKYTYNSKDYLYQTKYKTKDLEDNKNNLNKLINKNFYVMFRKDKVELPKIIIKDFINIKSDGSYTINEDSFESYITNLTYQYNNTRYENNKRIEDSYYANGTGSSFAKQIKDVNDNDVKIVPKNDHYEKVLTQKYKNVEKTYVEVNITSQYLWFYKDGKLFLQTPVVTGDHSKNYDTPTGKYKVYSKGTDIVLDGSTVGFDYKYHVDYWMPFNQGVGMHDTQERSTYEYGSDTYLYGGGSHGCVNMPPNMAKKMYENIKVGTSVYVSS